MKFGTARTNARRNDRLVRWIGFLALAALFAMATMPMASSHRDIAIANTTHWSSTWHG